MCWTFWSWSWTLELSPPYFEMPPVTTLLSARSAAKARRVAWICGTFLSISTFSLLPPQADHNTLVCQDRSERKTCGVNLLNILEPITDSGTFWNCHHPNSDCPTSPPSHLAKLLQKHYVWHESAGDSGADPGLSCCHDNCLHGPTSLLNVLKLISDAGAVTTITWTAPCHNTLVCQNCSKSTPRSKNPLDVLELFPDSSAITAAILIAPRHNRSICHNRCKCLLRDVDLLNILQGPGHGHGDDWDWHDKRENPTSRAEMSPPWNELPHVTTLSPPIHQRAKALDVAAIFGCCATAAMVSPSLSHALWRDFVGSKRRPSGPAIFRKLCSKDCCAAIFKSKILPLTGTDTSSHRPLGKETRTFRTSSIRSSSTCSTSRASAESTACRGCWGAVSLKFSSCTPC